MIDSMRVACEGSSFVFRQGQSSVDCSLRAHRHTLSLHCVPTTPLRETHEVPRGTVIVSGTESVAKLHTLPNKFARHVYLSSVLLHFVAGFSTPRLALTILPPTHIDLKPTPGPDVRCADALTTLRQRGLPLHSLRAAYGSRLGGAGS